MLDLFRRHLPNCPHRDKGRAYKRCDCPIHCDGEYKGVRVRKSLKTTNWERAKRRMAQLEEELETDKIRKTVAAAADAFVNAQEVQSATVTKYRRVMRRLSDFANSNRIEFMNEFTLEHLDGYKYMRPISALTWQKELQTLRGFW